MLKRIVSMKGWLLLGVVLTMLLVPILVYADTNEAGTSGMSLKVIGAVVFLFLVVGGFLGYLLYLQMRFLKFCRDEKQLGVFIQSPAGVPIGTVRAVIALIIVTVSFSLIILRYFEVTTAEFPEVVAGLLGTVLGFYFGNRGASAAKDEVAQGQIKDLSTRISNSEDEKKSSQTNDLLEKVKKGIAMSRAASVLFPEDIRKKYDDIIGKMEQGMKTVETLSGAGSFKEAAEEAGKVYEMFKKDNPAKDAYSKAVNSFVTVLGGVVPAAALAGTVVLLCAKIGGAVYQKWKARILHAPFSPAIIPLKVVDANTGFSLLLNCPVFKSKFARELDANDRPFIGEVVGLIGKTDIEDFWSKYKDRFDSREQFEAGLEELRRAAVDMELQNDIDPALLKDAGGYRHFMESIDKIHKDPDPKVKGALDQLFIVAEGLHKSGEPVISIFDKVKSEVAP